MVVLQVPLSRSMFALRSPQQFKLATGADQVWVFDGKYYAILAGLLFLWGLLFLDLVKDGGARRVISSGGGLFQFSLS